MNLGILGDLHYSNRGPSRRRDNFFQTQMAKTEQAFSIFKENHCQYVFQPGDMFDSHTAANKVKASVIALMKESYWKIYCVAGQHDMVGHSIGTLPNSPLAVLSAAEVIELLDDKGVELLNTRSTIDTVLNVYGASYGQPIPEPQSERTFNILVIHAMIGDRELYPGQDLTKPNQFLRNNPKFDLVICGDYHYRYRSSYQGRTIVNAGAIVRKTISTFDLEHKPSVAIFDTETKQVKFVELDIKPPKEIFDLSREVKLNSVDTEKFIQALKEGMKQNNVHINPAGSKSINWKDILVKVISEKKCSDEVKAIIDECLEEVRA